MNKSVIPDFAEQLCDSAYVAVAVGKTHGASPDSPLVAEIYKHLVEIEEIIEGTREKLRQDKKNIRGEAYG